MARMWILGASDPEMSAVEALLSATGEKVAYATLLGQLVSPSGAYAADAISREFGERRPVVWVECAPAEGGLLAAMVREMAEEGWAFSAVDHHRTGDAGYGRGPAEFMAGSSIGQVVAELAKLDLLPGSWQRTPWMIPGQCAPGVWNSPGTSPGCDDPFWWVGVGGAIVKTPDDLVLAAAADHCLSHAYRGRCPGVNPEQLMAWRAASRAAFQKRTVEAVRKSVV